jgi:hypothetical protein
MPLAPFLFFFCCFAAGCGGQRAFLRLLRSASPWLGVRTGHSGAMRVRSGSLFANAHLPDLEAGSSLIATCLAGRLHIPGGAAVSGQWDCRFSCLGGASSRRRRCVLLMSMGQGQ